MSHNGSQTDEIVRSDQRGAVTVLTVDNPPVNALNNVLRAALVATLAATVVAVSGWVGPAISGILALFPIVFTSMMLILHPRIGGPATAAVVANSGWGMVGFGLGITMLHVGALRFGSTVGLSLGLATCVLWNLALWWKSRRKAAMAR